MSLLDEYAVECVCLIKTRQDDLVGGYKTVWTDGTKFMASWEYQNAPAITVAEQEGVARVYNIYVDRTLDLDFHEAFRRSDTGEVYRVVNPGTDRKTPSFSLIDKQLVEVEKWELPHDGE